MDYLHLAGQQAVQRSANAEAITHLTTALELLKTLPDTPERTQQELTLQITLGLPLIATKGYAAPGSGKSLHPGAGAVPADRGDAAALPGAVGAVGVLFYAGGVPDGARAGGAASSAWPRGARPSLLLGGPLCAGDTLFLLGELASAREHLEQGIALYDPQQHRSHAFLYGEDPGVVSLSFAACALWFLGYPDQALKRSHEALTLAQELSHPFSLAFALTWLPCSISSAGRGKLAQERAEAVLPSRPSKGFRYWLAYGTILRGWALAEQGQGEEGIAQIRQGLAAWRATGAEI